MQYFEKLLLLFEFATSIILCMAMTVQTKKMYTPTNCTKNNVFMIGKHNMPISIKLSTHLRVRI